MLSVTISSVGKYLIETNSRASGKWRRCIWCLECFLVLEKPLDSISMTLLLSW